MIMQTLLLWKKSIPNGLASGEQWYLLVWSSDKEIGQADDNAPWYIEQLNGFEGSATPFVKSIETFSTSSSYTTTKGFLLQI